jgi:hypothetical protein
MLLVDAKPRIERVQGLACRSGPSMIANAGDIGSLRAKNFLWSVFLPQATNPVVAEAAFASLKLN